MQSYNTTPADGNMLASQVETRIERWARRISREKPVSIFHALAALRANAAARQTRDD